MKAVVQRVSRASVRVAGELVGRIGEGLLIFLGVEKGDGEEDARRLARKILRLRIFEEPAGKMNRSVTDIGGACLVVSQFTLCARIDKGNRPSFDRAEGPDRAAALYRDFVESLAEAGLRVETGRFAAEMDVELINAGPVTILADSGQLR